MSSQAGFSDKSEQMLQGLQKCTEENHALHDVHFAAWLSIHDESEVRDMGLFTDGFKLLKKASEPLYKTPKSIQETIEIMAVAENGILK